MPSPRDWYRRFFGLSDAEPTAGNTRPRDSTGSKYALASAGVELAAGVLLFAGLGYLLDNWLGTYPVLIIVGALLGLAGGFYLLIKAVKEQGKK